MLNPMTQRDLLFNMWNLRDNFIPPLKTKEILDFCDTSIEVKKRLWWPEWIKDLPKKIQTTPATKKYNTKKVINQAIKALNEKLEWWKLYKRNAPNEITKVYCDIHLKDYFKQKENLQKRLRYTGVKFNNDKLAMARQAPISDYLEFNSAGFARCPFHSEKTASFHKLPGKEKGDCFGCGRTADVIDVVMAQNNYVLPEALKIILKNL